MTIKAGWGARGWAVAGLVSACMFHARTAVAQPTEGESGKLATLQAMIDGQERRLEDQQAELQRAEAEIADQARRIQAERAEIAGLKAERPEDLAQVTARGPDTPPDQPYSIAQNMPVQPTPGSEPTVGEAPMPKTINAAVLPQGINILTAPGHLVAEASINYVQTNNNLLVFRGIEIVPGVEIGSIDANTTNHTESVAMETLRYGLFPRFEVEALIPYVYGTDRVTEAVQRDQQVTQTSLLRGSGLGDVEFTGRYQITDGRNGWPILVGNLRIKPPTGTGPFDLKYDQFGAAETLPTGSGFWGIEPSVSMLYTSDPAVIFASLGYLYNVSTNINKTIGGAVVGRVDPGGAIDASFGFAFSLNPRFSFSLGYRESYLRDTYEQINDTRQRSYALQVGSLLFGTSFRLTDRLTVSGNFEFGVTSDAPNVTATFRIPIVF